VLPFTHAPLRNSRQYSCANRDSTFSSVYHPKPVSLD
jgi:hypothetical protein